MFDDPGKTVILPVGGRLAAECFSRLTKPYKTFGRKAASYGQFSGRSAILRP
jgi:hypothetical protein